MNHSFSESDILLQSEPRVNMLHDKTTMIFFKPSFFQCWPASNENSKGISTLMKTAFCDKRNIIATITERPTPHCLSHSLVLHTVTTNESLLQSHGDITITSGVIPSLNVG
jgi:hypothetical protein